jgi:hypothetical protein
MELALGCAVRHASRPLHPGLRWRDCLGTLPRLSLTLVAVASLVGFSGLHAQSPPEPAFEVASVKANRFKLATHLETRERPIYLLTAARRDGRPGPSLRPGTGPATSLGASASITGRAVSMPRLASLLGSAGRRPVTDRTALGGTYDVELRWRPVGLAAAPPADLTPDSPDLFTAVQEQLGLKLESSRGPVDVMVVDRVARPTED